MLPESTSCRASLLPMYVTAVKDHTADTQRQQQGRSAHPYSDLGLPNALPPLFLQEVLWQVLIKHCHPIADALLPPDLCGQADGLLLDLYEI